MTTNDIYTDVSTVENKIKFDAYPFHYTIVYSDDIVKVSSVHKEECFEHQLILSQVLHKSTIQTNENDSANENEGIKISLSPKQIYDLFKMYDENKMPEHWKMTFPEGLKNESLSLCIIIETDYDFPKTHDTKFLYLNPVPILKEDLLLKKIEHFKVHYNKQTQYHDVSLENLSINYDKLEKKYGELVFKFINLTTHLTGRITELQERILAMEKK